MSDPLITIYRRKLRTSMTVLALLRDEHRALCAQAVGASAPSSITELGARIRRASAPAEYLLLHLECRRLSRDLRRSIQALTA